MIKRRVIGFYVGLILLVVAFAVIQNMMYHNLNKESITPFSISNEKKFYFLSAEKDDTFAYLTFRIVSDEEGNVRLGYTFYNNNDVVKEGEESLFVAPGEYLHTLKLILPKQEAKSAVLSAYLNGEVFYETKPFEQKRNVLTGNLIGEKVLGRVNVRFLSFIGLFLAIAFIVSYLIYARSRKKQLEFFEMGVEKRDSFSSLS